MWLIMISCYGLPLKLTDIDTLDTPDTPEQRLVDQWLVMHY